MKKVTLGNYRVDKYYPRIVRAVAEILVKGDVVTPIEVFLRMDLLRKEDVESWRFGHIPYLEKVIHCNLGKISRILRILRMHVHDLNMRPSQTAYVKWGKGRRTPLRFSKTGDPNLKDAYSLHFLAPKKRRQRTEEVVEEVDVGEATHSDGEGEPVFPGGIVLP